MRKLAAPRDETPFIGDKPLNSISLCVYGDSKGLRFWNSTSDLTSINIAENKTLEECIFYQGDGITVYCDNVVTVQSYEGFYDYFLLKQSELSNVSLLPTEEVEKDKEYYNELVHFLADEYNKQIENTPNVLSNIQVLQNVNTPVPINFGCTVFQDGTIWTGEGYSVGTANKPACPVNVPSGKFSFITNATSETHSFVVKCCRMIKTFGVSGGTLFTKRYPVIQGFQNNFGSYIEFNYQESSQAYVDSFDFLLSSLFLKDSLGNTGTRGGTGVKNMLNLTYALHTAKKTLGNDSFKQLLIYKSNLTETELKGELAKDIKLR